MQGSFNFGVDSESFGDGIHDWKGRRSIQLFFKVLYQIILNFFNKMTSHNNDDLVVAVYLHLYIPGLLKNIEALN